MSHWSQEVNIKKICKSCSKDYTTTKRKYYRSKYKECPDCVLKRRRSLIKEAAKNIKPFEEPTERYCKSCYTVKPYSEFSKGRHTCKKCHIIGRGAYYHMAKEY